MQLIFFITLFLLYFAHNIWMSGIFRKKYHKSDDFIGRNAPNETQRYFGKVMYSILGYYLPVFIYIVTGFNFWGLISEITLLLSPAVQIFGFVFCVLFLALMTAARLNLGASWRVGLDYETTDNLITNGFYRYSRNPYFAFLLAFEGCLIFISPNALVIFAFIQSALLLGLQVRQEEMFLQEKYGDEYLAYKSKTGRFLPKLLK